MTRIIWWIQQSGEIYIIICNWNHKTHIFSVNSTITKHKKALMVLYTIYLPTWNGNPYILISNTHIVVCSPVQSCVQWLFLIWFLRDDIIRSHLQFWIVLNWRFTRPLRTRTVDHNESNCIKSNWTVCESVTGQLIPEW